MTATALNFTPSEAPFHAPRNSISTVELERFAEDYLRDCDYRMQSPRTIETRRIFIQNLLWFLRQRDYASCGTPELRQFFSYLQHGHSEPGGRWGKARLNKPLRPVAIRDYYVNLR